MTISEQLRQFIIDNYLFGENEDRLSDDTSFLESAILDSTGLLELIGFLEQTYGFRLEDREIVPENLDSIARLTRFVQAKQDHTALQPV